MTIGQLKQMISIYPDHKEILVVEDHKLFELDKKHIGEVNINISGNRFKSYILFDVNSVTQKLAGIKLKL